MLEPYFSYNVFFNAIIIGGGGAILGFALKLFIKRAFDDFHLGWEKYEAEKEKNLNNWREATSANLCSVKQTLDNIKTQMPVLVTAEECDASHAEIHHKVNDHGQRIGILETKVSDLRRINEAKLRRDADREETL